MDGMTPVSNRDKELEEKEDRIVERLRELTECSTILWETNMPSTRSYSTDYRGVRFELEVNQQRLTIDSIEVTDNRGLLDELVWAVELQVNPPTMSGGSSMLNPRDQLQEILDKLEG